jgi:hypothetical protein
MPLFPVVASEALPRDVQRFVDKREGCDHMRGEIPEPGDKRRMQEVNREIQKLCKGTDKELAQLKKKYAKHPSVLQRLDEFEPDIEAPRCPLHEVERDVSRIQVARRCTLAVVHDEPPEPEPVRFSVWNGVMK